MARDGGAIVCRRTRTGKQSSKCFAAMLQEVWGEVASSSSFTRSFSEDTFGLEALLGKNACALYSSIAYLIQYCYIFQTR